MSPVGDSPFVTRRFKLVFGFILLFLLTFNICTLWSTSAYHVFSQGWLPSISGPSEQSIGTHTWQKSKEPTVHEEVEDDHPIRHLMHYADQQFQQYDQDRSRTFKATVEKYRRMHGRHPPPGFKEWYKFARERHVQNIDDFRLIYDDLRPFWALPPAEIRRYAAHASDVKRQSVATISVRGGSVFQDATSAWRSETFMSMLRPIARWLPDMDIPMNSMDQPRVVVPWDEMQLFLQTEESSRSTEVQGVEDRFTKNQAGLWTPHHKSTWLDRWNPFTSSQDRVETPEDPRPEYGWVPHPGSPFMDVAAKACPPESYARNNDSVESLHRAEASYKLELGGLVTNHNLSSDLCTVGPQLSQLHGFLAAPVSMQATAKLIPIFSECKTSVNSDILFPANMYWKTSGKQAKVYSYDDEQDVGWDDKNNVMTWRGVTSGGLAFAKQPERWHSMHRQRLALKTNSTVIAGNSTSVLALSSRNPDVYSSQEFFPADFAKDHLDVGFTRGMGCIPNCDFYNHTFRWINKMPFAETFQSKFLVDVDGHSFSGRWRAYLQSRSLGIKTTIFREWHDSRLHAWRHFVPLDNRYDELYSLLAYFIGVGSDSSEAPGTSARNSVDVVRHDYEAFKIAKQGRDWAAKVLRKEDMEIYLFRLLLEYGRIIDDDRDRIGTTDDGGAEMEDFDRRYPPWHDEKPKGM